MGSQLICSVESSDRYERLFAMAQRTAVAFNLLPEVIYHNDAARYIRKEALRLLQDTTPHLASQFDLTDLERDSPAFWGLAALAGCAWTLAESHTERVSVFRERPNFWERLMTEWPMGEYAKMMAEFLIARGLLKGSVLELGAGVGNTTRLIKDHVDGGFIRTDLYNKLFERVPDVKGQSRIYDFDEPWKDLSSEQLQEPWIEPEKFSTIFATNALHCARDPEKTLSYMLDILEPGGILVLAEGAPMMSDSKPWPLNMLFGMFRGWYDRTGFLSRRQWVFMLRRVGFKNIGWAKYRAGKYDLGGLIWGSK